MALGTSVGPRESKGTKQSPKRELVMDNREGQRYVSAEIRDSLSGELSDSESCRTTETQACPQDCTLYWKDIPTGPSNQRHCFEKSFSNLFGGFPMNCVWLLYISSIFSKCGNRGSHHPTSTCMTSNGVLKQIYFQTVKNYIKDLQKTSSKMFWIMTSFSLSR